MQKQVLLRKHEQQQQQTKGKATMTTLGLSSFMLSPSTDVSRDLSVKQPMFFEQLSAKPNHVHEGGVIFCRSVVLPVKSAGGAVVSLVEDKKGDLFKSSFYNYCDFYDDLANVLPHGSMLAIINPYGKKIDGENVLRVDNPSSIVRFYTKEDFFAASGWSWAAQFGSGGVEGNINNATKTAEDWKEEGNELFTEKRFREAAACYTHGLRLDPSNVTLLSNRSAAFLVLGEYEESYEDARRCLSIEPGHVKSSFRLVKSLFLLRRFAECISISAEYEAGVLRGNAEVRDILTLARRAKQEAVDGRYDVNVMIKEQTIYSKIEGHNDYTNPKISFEAGVPGSGGRVRCISDLKSGELVMACKAFEVVGSDEIPEAQYVDADTNRARTSVGQMLAGRLMRKVTDKPERAKELYQLFANGFVSAANLKQVNLSRILAIEDSNAFTWTKDPLRLAQTDYQGKAGSGIWIKPSFLRHSCVPNCHKFFVGDYLFVCTSFDVPKGEELTFSYVDTPVYNEAHMTLQEVRGIDCSCTRCKYFTAHLDVADKESALYDRYRTIGKKFLEAQRVDLSRLDFTPMTELIDDIRALFPNEPIQRDGSLPYSLIEHDVLYLLSTMSDAKQEYQISKTAYERMLKFADEEGIASLKSLYCRLNLARIALVHEQDTERARRMRDEIVRLWASNYGGLFSEAHLWKIFGMQPFAQLKSL